MNFCRIKNKIIGKGKPVICVPLVGRTEEEIFVQLEEIVKKSEETAIDMVEFRGDFYDKLGDMDKLSEILLKVSKKLNETDVILLFTIRSYIEGGEKLSFEKPSIYDINSYVIKNKLADIVDVELFAGEEQAKKLIEMAQANGVRIIMSNHDFHTTPEKNVIISRLVKMQELGADIVKIAVMPHNMNHVFSLLEATYDMREQYDKTPIVTMSMGKLGAISRLSGQIFGSAITFATVGEASAPGQIPVDELGNVMDVIDRFCV